MAVTEVKLQKWGNSQGIRISKDLLEQLEFKIQEMFPLKSK